MQIKRHGEPTSLAKIRKGSLEEMLAAAAASGGMAAGLPPYNRGELRRALERVLGLYVTNPQLSRILTGTGVTLASVRRAGSVRWVKIDRDAYYSMEDIQRLLASRRGSG